MLQQRGHPRAPAGGIAEVVHEQRLLHDLAHGHARIERGERVLEHDLHAPAQRPQPLAVKIVDIAALEADGARGGLDQPRHEARGGGLAAAELADQGQGLAAVQCERDAINGANDAGGAAEQDAVTDREVTREVFNDKDGVWHYAAEVDGRMGADRIPDTAWRMRRWAQRPATTEESPNSAASSAYDRRRASGSCTVLKMAISST